jgi:hypothetical protein
MAKVQSSVPCCQTAIFVVNVESNMSWAAPSVEKYLNENWQLKNKHTFLREDHRVRKQGSSGGGGGGGQEAVITAGTRTTSQNKPDMIEGLGKLMRNEQICFHSNVVHALLDEMPEHHGRKNPVETLIRELSTFSRELVYPKTSKDQAYVRPVIKYRGAKGVDRDDGVMTLAINLFQTERFFASPAYRNFH